MENLLGDDYFMQQALKLARRAFEEDEIPVGAIVVCENQIIGKGYNQTERLNDVTAHAEMLALTAAFSALNAKYLKECTLYVTLEPCVMCAGALYWSQIDRIVFGAKDIKRGYQSVNQNIIHPKTEILGGIQEEECARLMKEFFQAKRN
ncbi:MAG: tRNA adenosine(34) deaminase TadA [Bacteroidota bacterium]|nr:tRNA adenosine(34) deaminase TadA [Bacteroidota bacterium]MDX5431000.1 tRNA adenosine(34) deaminase TadA [Bacteroidota bacterium]MDX5469751.1 tRNA adenosine(34) deaminase TadA [Bacteroidota bacterium]